MSTVVADVVTDLKDRLIVTSASSEPGDAVLGRWVLASAKYAIGALQPPKESVVTVTSVPSLSLTADIVYYVAVEEELLLPVEWAKQGNTIQLQPQAAATGQKATVWHFTAPTLSSATTTFDTTCIFGPDWLEEVITMMTGVMVELRRSFTAPSADGTGHASMMRVLQDERDRLLQPYVRARNAWAAEMDGRLQARANIGDRPFSKSAYSAFRNGSRWSNKATGVS